MAKKKKPNGKAWAEAGRAALAKKRAQAWAEDTTGRSFNEMFPRKTKSKESEA